MKEKEQNRICKICGKPMKKKVIETGAKPITFWIFDCDCEEKAEAEKQRRKDNFKRYKELRRQYKEAGFTRRQLGIRLRKIDNEHKEMFLEWLEDFKPRRSKGMYFYGGVGNGKTTCGSCIAKELVNKGYKNVYFYTMAEYLNKMQQTYSEDSPITFDAQMRKWINADAIFIDDFGREKYSEKRLENVFLFFDGLYNNCTTFFVISNPENMLRIKEIPEFEAIFDRFSETLDKVVFKGKSKRRKIDE